MSGPHYENLRPMDHVKRAEHLAYALHESQTDKAGEPYIYHPLRMIRIMHTLADYRLLGPAEKSYADATVWLHDLVEDTPLTILNLADFGFPPPVVVATGVLTHARHRPRAEYLAEVAGNPIARVGKIADGLDNTDDIRLARIEDPEDRARQIAKGVQTFTILGRPDLAADLDRRYRKEPSDA